MALKTRPPTGAVPPPVVLLEGETGAGRSWTAAELSASDKVGVTYWMELGDESTADQYGAIPNVRYQIVKPDNKAEVWDWHAIYGAARDFKAEAHRASEAGEKPPVLVVDQVGAIWDLLGEWADNRARSTEANKKALAENPNYEYIVTSNFWNDATARWKKLMSLYLTSKGVVILLSRGEEVTLFENGKPSRQGKKTWKVAGQKAFTSSMPIWVRMTRDGNPQLIKLRVVVNGIRPGVDRQEAFPSFTLEKLIFERYAWNPATSGYRTLVPMVAGEDAPESEKASILLLAVETAEDLGRLKGAFDKIRPALNAGEITQAEAQKVSALVTARKAELEAKTPKPETPSANGREPATVGASA